MGPHRFLQTVPYSVVFGAWLNQVGPNNTNQKALHCHETRVAPVLEPIDDRRNLIYAAISEGPFHNYI